jgi:uncharacterized damage-inducible protein DinB
MTKPYLQRLFPYIAWANQQTLASLVNCPAAQIEGTPLLAHLLAAEHVWLSRLEHREPRLAVWPKLSLEECQAQAVENDHAWATYIDGLTDERLRSEIDYRNSRGEPFRDLAVDILTQVATHGGYHRGQIAKIVGRSGGKAAVTDFIVYVRLGCPAAR